MKHLNDQVIIRKSSKQYEIVIHRSYLDQFGKLFEETKLWDTARTRDLAIKLSNDTQSMANCGYKVV